MDKDTLLKRMESAKTLGGHPRFYEIMLENAIMHAKKNHDYAKDTDPLSNLKECEKFGIPAWKGALVRITDKISRITQLANGKHAEITDENIFDTLRDLSIYAILTMILLESQNSTIDKG